MSTDRTARKIIRALQRGGLRAFRITKRLDQASRPKRYRVFKRPREDDRPEPVLIDARQLEASICRDSLYDFLQRFWTTVIQEEPVWNWHMKFLCDELQAVAERLFRGEDKEYDLVINVPPGTTKSTICSVMFPAWCWTRMRTCKIISSSYTHDLSIKLSRKSRDIVTSQKWRELFGDIELRDDQNSKSNYETKAGGWRFACSTDGSVTGNHAHFILVDDPLDPMQAVSELELASANRFVKETLSQRKISKKISVTILIMQRLHQNDPSAVLIEESKLPNGQKVRHICLPGEITGRGRDQVRPRRAAAYYVDGLLDPVRLDKKILAGELVRLGEYGYAGQILQTPVPRGGGMFKTGRIKPDQPGPLRHFKRVVRYWDKAGTQDGGCWTAGVKLGLDKNDMVWILDVVRGQWESHQREDTIHQTAVLDTAEFDGNKQAVEIGVEQEPGSGGKESAIATIRRLQGFIVHADAVKGSKEIRADPLSVQVNGHNVRLALNSKGAPPHWAKVFIDEMQHFPLSKYKDQVDAASGAYAILSTERPRAGGAW